MAQVIQYDPASYVIANRVTRYLRSVQESDWAAVPNTVIYHASGDPPEVAALIAAEVPMSNWKVVGGVVQQLSQADMDAITAQQAIDNAAAAAANLVALKAYAKDQLVSRTEFREAFEALCEVIVPEINALRSQVVGVQTLVWDAPSLANAAGTTSSNITVTGAAFGDFVEVSCSISFGGLLAFGYVSAANTVNIRLHNGTGGAVNLASATFTVCVLRRAAMPARTAAQVKTSLKNAYDGKIDTWT